MNQPAHDWALLQDMDEDAEEQLNQEWWQAIDLDTDWQNEILSRQEND